MKIQDKVPVEILKKPLRFLVKRLSTGAIIKKRYGFLNDKSKNMSFLPNTTPTPNWLYNGEMKKMNETELKVVLLVTRKTLGWFDPMTSERKTQDYVSQKQFMEFTGQSNRAIATAIQSCVRSRWIIAKDKNGKLCDTPNKRERRKVWYQLGNIFTKKASKQQSGLDKKSGEESSQDKNLVNIFPKSGEHNDTHLVNNVHSTKETLTKETIQKKRISEQSSQINIAIELFKIINPSYQELFKNKTQRSACERLLKKWTLKQLAIITEKVLPELNADRYAKGKSITPLELERNLGYIKSFVESYKEKRGGVLKL